MLNFLFLILFLISHNTNLNMNTHDRQIHSYMLQFMYIHKHFWIKYIHRPYLWSLEWSACYEPRVKLWWPIHYIFPSSGIHLCSHYILGTQKSFIWSYTILSAVAVTLLKVVAIHPRKERRNKSVITTLLEVHSVHFIPDFKVTDYGP